MKNSNSILALLAFLIIFPLLPSVYAAEKPNIVVIMTDNLGYGDLGAYGGMRAPTPRIDALAAEGIRFRDFQVEPGCTQTRAAFMTGRMPIRSGNSGFVQPGGKSGLHPKEITLAEMLKKVGYKTTLFGKWHVGTLPERQPQMQGFDKFWGILFTSKPTRVGSPAYDPSIPMQPILEAERGKAARKVKELTMAYRPHIDRDITNMAVDYVKDNAGGDNPFFLFVSFINPHVPVIPHPDFRDKSGGGDYPDVLMEIDYNTGQILDALKREKISENTIVVWISDNGPTRYSPEPDQNGDPGQWSGDVGSAWEGSLRTPGMIRWPAKIRPNWVSDATFHIMDLYTTLARFAGGQVPEDRPIDGIDQSDYLLGKSDISKRDHIMTYYLGELAAIRWKQFKVHLVKYAKRRAIQSPGIKVFPPLFGLYNLRTDPKEEYDLWGSGDGSTYPLIIKANQLRAKYDKSFKAYPHADYSNMEPIE